MNRPLADLRPVGPFVSSIREDSGGGNGIWAVHRIDVRKPNFQFDEFSEGMLIREFGGMERISESAESLKPEGFDFIAETMEIGSNVRISVRYDIIPPADGEGIRLQYYIYEKIVEDERITRPNSLTFTDEYFEEQGQFYANELGESFPDSEVLHAKSGATPTRPDTGDSDLILYYTEFHTDT